MEKAKLKQKRFRRVKGYECKTYAESMLKSNALKDADRSVLERQLKDARNILACHWAVSLHSNKIPKRYLEPLQWAIVEAFNMGRHFERMRIRPAGPNALTGRDKREIHAKRARDGKSTMATEGTHDVLKKFEKVKVGFPPKKWVSETAKRCQPRYERAHEEPEHLSESTVRRILKKNGKI